MKHRYCPVFRGKVENGTLKIKHVQEFNKYLHSIKGEVDIIVRKRSRTRTLPQNALYWVWNTIIAEELGYMPEEIHATFKAMFLTDKTSRLPVVRSTATLNTAEFTEYMQNIERTAAELGITLPRPDEIDAQ